MINVNEFNKFCEDGVEHQSQWDIHKNKMRF